LLGEGGGNLGSSPFLVKAPYREQERKTRSGREVRTFHFFGEKKPQDIGWKTAGAAARAKRTKRQVTCSLSASEKIAAKRQDEKKKALRGQEALGQGHSLNFQKEDERGGHA